MSEQSVVTLALLALIVVLVVAGVAILGPQLGQLFTLPEGVLR